MKYLILLIIDDKLSQTIAITLRLCYNRDKYKYFIYYVYFGPGQNSNLIAHSKSAYERAILSGLGKPNSFTI